MIRSWSPARGPSRSQNLSKSCPLPGNLILPGTCEGFGREAGNGPGGYAPGHDTDGGPHPNRFEPRRVFLDIAVERSLWVSPRPTCNLVSGLAEDGIHRNCFPPVIVLLRCKKHSFQFIQFPRSQRRCALRYFQPERALICRENPRGEAQRAGRCAQPATATACRSTACSSTAISRSAVPKEHCQHA
jgi:hypothetical protein